jgi:hypothetical protein
MSEDLYDMLEAALKGISVVLFMIAVLCGLGYIGAMMAGVVW